MTNSTVTKENDTHYLSGGVQVCVDTEWATVCQFGWDDNDATVACNQLGLYYDGSKSTPFQQTLQYNILIENTP